MWENHVGDVEKFVRDVLKFSKIYERVELKLRKFCNRCAEKKIIQKM